MAPRAALTIALIAIAFCAPLFASEFWVTLLMQIMIFGLLALSTDLLLGQAGLFSLCHAAFFALSAYTVAILQVRHGFGTALAAPIGILAGTALAFVFASAVRTRGVYFILITLAFGYIVWGVAYRWASFTGGDNGVTGVPFPSLGSLRVASTTDYYYVVLSVVLVVAAAYRVLVTSPFGLALRGIKSSESRMRSLGYNVGQHLYVAFVLSGLIASIAGVLYVYFNRFVNPTAASFPISVEAVLMTIVGGTGTILGPFLGSGIILVLRNWASGYFHYYTAVLGVVFIVTVLWAPQGIMGLLARWRSGNRGEGA
ncbi:MAG: branched-chain amino acid transport system permease protein [Hyphomicrobiales bacterium]|jgi:branched-chain amino acid transport system permease protein|nr:branched-chain amino acid transport system permease protein [Hyphomicrobiales bacterium]